MGLKDTDLFMVSRDGVNYKIPASDVGGSSTEIGRCPPGYEYNSVSQSCDLLDPNDPDAVVDSGTLWFNPNNGITYIWYNNILDENDPSYDPFDGQWVDVRPKGAGEGNSDAEFINKPSILAPGNGAGLGGGPYTPKTSAVTAANSISDTQVDITVQDTKTYKADDGSDAGQPISETFLGGQRVVGKDASKEAHGTLITDAVANTLKIRPDKEPEFIKFGNTSSQWSHVVYSGTQFAAVGYQGAYNCMTSTDGINWDYSNGLPSKTTAYGMAYGNGVYVVVGTNFNTLQRVIHYSTNGLSWAQAADPTGMNAGDWSAVAYGDGQFIAVQGGVDAFAYTSPDGQTWTPAGTIGIERVKDINYGNGQFMACGSTGVNRIAMKPDGGSWTPVFSSNYNNTVDWHEIDYVNGKWYASTRSTTDVQFMSSVDGNTWTEASEYYSTNMIGFAGDGTVTMAAGANSGVYASEDDGLTWPEYPMTEPPLDTAGYRDIAFGADRFVIVSSDTTFDGVSIPSFGGEFVGGMEIFGEEVANLGPDTTNLEFVGSIPKGQNIKTWGDAHWEISQNNFGTTLVDTKNITLSNETQSLLPIDRLNITLNPLSTYQLRLKYTSLDPDISSEYSSVVNFKTGTTFRTPSSKTTLYYDKNAQQTVSYQEIIERFGIDPENTNLNPFDIAELTEQPNYPVLAYVPVGDKYKPVPDQTNLINSLRYQIMEDETTIEDIQARLDALEDE